MTNIANITTVGDEDRKFIQDVAKLTADKKALVKGIVIGLQLEDNKKGEESNEQKYNKSKG